MSSENFGWKVLFKMAWRVIFVVVIGKLRVENGKISGGEWENFEYRNIFEGKCLKKVIRNLAYREMLFYKKFPAHIYFYLSIIFINPSSLRRNTIFINTMH